MLSEARLTKSSSLTLRPEQNWFTTETFLTPMFRDAAPSRNFDDLHPMVHFIDAMDLIGRVHALGATFYDVQNPREVDQRASLTRGMHAAARRWFNELPPQVRDMDDVLSSSLVLTVGLFRTASISDPTDSLVLVSIAHTMRESLLRVGNTQSLMPLLQRHHQAARLVRVSSRWCDPWPRRAARDHLHSVRSRHLSSRHASRRIARI